MKKKILFNSLIIFVTAFIIYLIIYFSINLNNAVISYTEIALNYDKLFTKAYIDNIIENSINLFLSVTSLAVLLFILIYNNKSQLKKDE